MVPRGYPRLVCLHLKFVCHSLNWMNGFLTGSCSNHLSWIENGSFIRFLAAGWHHDVAEKRNGATASSTGDLRLLREWGNPMQIMM